MRLAIAGLAGPRRARVQIIDAQHGSPLAAWEAMGRPAFPTRHQIQVLRDAAALPDAIVRDLAQPVILPPHASPPVKVMP
jgi:beta-xylosidase